MQAPSGTPTAEVKVDTNAEGTATIRRNFTYDRWMLSQGVPLYTGYFVEDLRTIKLGRWESRQCDAAFIQLVGQEGVAEGRISEIRPGATLPRQYLAFDEVVYVLDGRGATTVWQGDERTSFEWEKSAMFVLPHNTEHQFHNTQGERAVRLLHYNYLPLAMSVVAEPDFYFVPGAQSAAAAQRNLKDFYQEAQELYDPEGKLWARRKNAWSGNFFPDMRVWEKLEPNRTRGAGGHSVFMTFPGTEISCHMSVFPARTYKKAHRHGPGRVIVIPAGEGYSIMYEEDQEKVLVPWHEASVFVPPNRWFHQHFNVGGTPARYLALHPPIQFYGHSERVEDLRRDQIEYADEPPEVRARFEGELAKRGLTSLIPDEVYQTPGFEWSYTDKK